MCPKIEVYDSLESAKQEFGENFDAYVFRLTRAQIEALLQGRVVAFDISNGEYAGFLVSNENDLPAIFKSPVEQAKL
jgi:hypothetical protein